MQILILILILGRYTDDKQGPLGLAHCRKREDRNKKGIERTERNWPSIINHPVVDKHEK
jgi:hypothetical protein